MKEESMRLFPYLAALCVLASALAQSRKAPPTRKPQIDEVRATGCVQIAPDGCVLLKTLDGKTTYSFEAAPKPEAGLVITIQGTAHKGRSKCKQGIVIDVSDWEETGEMCSQ